MMVTQINEAFRITGMKLFIQINKDGMLYRVTKSHIRRQIKDLSFFSRITAVNTNYRTKETIITLKPEPYDLTCPCCPNGSLDLQQDAVIVYDVDNYGQKTGEFDANAIGDPWLECSGCAASSNFKDNDFNEEIRKRFKAIMAKGDY